MGVVFIVLGVALMVTGSLLLIAIHIRRRWLSNRQPRHITKVCGESYVTEELLRCNHFQLHNRLQKDRFGPAEPILEGYRAGHLVGYFRRVNLVVTAIIKGYFDINHRVTGNGSGFYRSLNTSLYCRDKLLGYGATFNPVNELEAAVLFHRL